jgi:AhpD family alkylhydroperoxidase
MLYQAELHRECLRAILAANVGFELSLERAAALPARLNELASIKVATRIGCRFCIDIGASLARGHGVSVEALLDLARHETSPHFSALERRALDYAVAMTETPMNVPRALFESLRAELGARPGRADGGHFLGESSRALQPCVRRDRGGFLRAYVVPAAGAPPRLAVRVIGYRASNTASRSLGWAAVCHRRARSGAAMITSTSLPSVSGSTASVARPRPDDAG